MHKRGAAILGGLYAGVFLGTLAGLAEAGMLLEGGNLATTPGWSILFLLCAVSLYAVIAGAFGALIGLIISIARRDRSGAPAAIGRPFSTAFGIISGLFTFILGAWWVRLAPPDLAVFRRYCLPETLLMLLMAVVVGLIAALVTRWIARADRVERYLASRWARNWTFAKLAAAIVLLVLFLGPAAPDRSPRGSSEAGGTGVNVVLITIDTLRADHLELAGYGKPTSPVSRELAKGAIVFDECVAQFPLTTPSHASILSSRYVRSHGATGNAVALHESVVLLSDVLKLHGYETAGFVTSPIIGQKYGFARSFDTFVERNRGDFAVSTIADWVGQLRLSRVWWRLTGRQRTAVATRRWIESRPRTPFFLWLHHIAPHAPYSPPFAYERAWDTIPSSIIPSLRVLRDVNEGERAVSEEDVEHIKALYDADIAFTEDLLGDTIEALRKSGFLQNTLIVFTADHGECLYDRGRYFGHGAYLHDEEVLVPLFFSCPGLIEGGRRVGVPIETIHIAPTILDFLGLPPEPSFQGMSLMDFIDPDHPNADSHIRHPLSEKPAFSIRNEARTRGVRFDGWKYIEHEDPSAGSELYDLASDPGETRNLVAERPERAAELRRILHEWDRDVPVVRSESYELDEESLRALRSLGYIE